MELPTSLELQFQYAEAILLMVFSVSLLWLIAIKYIFSDQNNLLILRLLADFSFLKIIVVEYFLMIQ